MREFMRVEIERGGPGLASWLVESWTARAQSLADDPDREPPSELAPMRSPEEDDLAFMARAVADDPDANVIEIEDRIGGDLSNLLSPKRLELLDFIAAHRPRSIREASRKLGRGYRNTYDDCMALVKAELVTLHTEGRSRRPVSFVRAIRFEMDAPTSM